MMAALEASERRFRRAWREIQHCGCLDNLGRINENIRGIGGSSYFDAKNKVAPTSDTTFFATRPHAFVEMPNAVMTAPILNTMLFEASPQHPDTLEYTEVPPLIPGDDEVLVKADTIGVSMPEVPVRRGAFEKVG
jgi:hypothetical protein